MTTSLSFLNKNKIQIQNLKRKMCGDMAHLKKLDRHKPHVIAPMLEFNFNLN